MAISPQKRMVSVGLFSFLKRLKQKWCEFYYNFSWENFNDILCNCWNSLDVAMLIQHWRYYGQLFQVTLSFCFFSLLLSWAFPWNSTIFIESFYIHSRFIYWRVCCFVCTREPKRRMRRADLQRSLYHSQAIRLPNRASMRRSIRLPHNSNDITIDIPYAPRLSHAYSDTELR